MNWKLILLLLAVFCFLAMTGLAEPSNAPGNLDAFRKRAVKFKAVITLPTFETTTNDVSVSLQQTITNGNAALDHIGALQPREVNFRNTVRALDDLGYQVGLTENRLSVIKETSTDAALRDAATDAIKSLDEWSVGLDYREDVYRAVKAYADTKPKLKGEDAKLLFETMRDYRRAGLDLPKPVAMRSSGCAKNFRA